MNLQSESMTGFFPENDRSARSIENVPADSEIDWLNAPFTFDDGQQALFWIEWGRDSRWIHAIMHACVYFKLKTSSLYLIL